jgi:S1-C subfamily serine protease
MSDRYARADAEVAAWVLRRRLEAEGGQARRRGSAVLSYFGAAVGSKDDAVAAALKHAGIDCHPQPDEIEATTIAQLRLRAADGAPPDPPDMATLTLSIPDLVNQIAPAVVHVFSSEGTGSGFGFDASGLLVTNAHVVGGDEKVRVKFEPGNVADAEVVGRDGLADVAVLRVQDVQVKPLTLKPLGAVRVGDAVVAIGSPLDLEWTVTQGIVSAKQRAMRGDVGVSYLLQTDATITHGNSGGPLVALDGRVVGMTSRGFEGVALNFAVPSDTIGAVAQELIEHGNVERATLGMRVGRAPFFGEQADAWGQDGGALVLAVQAEGPAAEAGVKAEDVILSFNGELIDDAGDLFRLLARSCIGCVCKVELVRDGQQLDLEVMPALRNG